MATSREAHLAFWQAVAGKLAEDAPTVEALRAGEAAAADPELTTAGAAVRRALEAGAGLSRALSDRPDMFSSSMAALVRAGEESGCLDLAAGFVAEGLADGCFTPPGCAPEGDAMARTWRAFARLVLAGAPVLESLDALRAEAQEPRLAETLGGLCDGLAGGSTLAEAMRAFPESFPRGLCDAVADAERTATLDAAALRVAELLQTGAATSPGEQPSAAPPEPADDASRARAFARALLEEAHRLHASDVHIDAVEGGRSRARVRIDGVLHEFAPEPAAGAPSPVPHIGLAARVKIMAGMDISERRTPQDGRMQLELGGEAVDVRVSTVPTLYGERLCMRLLRRAEPVFDLAALGLSASDLGRVTALARQPHGIVLCTAPAGSGKTTLLYSMLTQVDRDRCAVMSIEDPVEYDLPGVAQAQVRAAHGLTFARLARQMLRQDPDVMLLGEIRDLETLQLATQIALTGHLLLTTLHADTAPGGVRRMLDMGLAPYLVNSTLQGVISTRLVRLLCPECRRPVAPDPASLPPDARAFVERLTSPEFHDPGGCQVCHGTGYRGRTAIYEVLVPDDGLRRVVAEQGDVRSIREAAMAAGMKTLLQDGLAKAAAGRTSLREVLRVTPT